MKVNLENIKDTEKKIDVYIPQSKVKEKTSEIFKEFKKNAKIKGFRPGKAPDSVVRSMYKENIDQEVTSELVSDSLPEALKEVSLQPINRPHIHTDDLNPEQDFHYSAVFEVIPEFELSDYTGLEITRRKVEVEDEHVEKTLKNIQERSAQSKLVEEDRAVQKGDYVVVDFEGSIDGEVIEDLKKENVQFLVGEGQLIDEFENNLLGMKKGEEKKFDVNYDENFQIEQAAGRTVNYTLKVNEIYDRILPELNDEFAKEVGFDSFDELKKKIREDLHSQLEREEQNRITEQILDTFDKKNEIEVPDSLVQQETSRLKRDYMANYQRQGMQPPQFNQEMDKQFEERAKRNVKSSIILSEIAKKEDISVSSKEIDDRLKQIADSVQMPYENVKQVYKDNNMLSNLEGSIIEEKVLEFVKEKASFKEEKPEEKSEEAGDDNLVDNK